MRVFQISQAQPQTTMQAIQSSQAGGSTLYSSSTGCPTTEYSVLSTPTFTRSTPLPVSSRSAVTTSDPPQTQLPTPVNSDTPLEVAKRSSHRSKIKTSQADLEALEDPVQDDDEDDDGDDDGDDDDDEMVELAKRIEKSAGSKETSPPARARKFNIRETHEYDDYGGALFTEEERELLGTSPCCSEFAASTNAKQTRSNSRKVLGDPLFAANFRCQLWIVHPYPVFPTQALCALASGSAKLSTPAAMLYATIGT